MQQAGLRWTQPGAQVVLDLRGVCLTGHGDAYWRFHRQQQHTRLYGHTTVVPATVEDQALELAA